MSPQPNLTAQQKAKQSRRQRQHREREARMPYAERPRLSPQKNIPKPCNGVTPDLYTSMRCCMENPEKHPNDFRYLYRRANNGTEVEYMWFSMEGNRSAQTYDNLPDAIMALARAGWEDASW